MTYLLVAIIAVIFAAAFLFWIHLENCDRRYDATESLRFAAMAPEERLKALVFARHERAYALAHYDYIHTLWRNYRWGYRRNPYFIGLVIAQWECARTEKRVTQLESLVDSEQATS